MVGSLLPAARHGSLSGLSEVSGAATLSNQDLRAAGTHAEPHTPSSTTGLGSLETGRSPKPLVKSTSNGSGEDGGL